MNLELETDGSDFRGNPEAPRPLVAVRVPSGSGAAFLGPNRLIFLGIWAQSACQALLNA
jgi:hypothetical protein